MMLQKRHSLILRTIAFLLVIAAIIPMGAQAAVADPAQPYASNYLISYNAYVYAAGGGSVQVYFSAHGTSYLDDLGCLSVSIYESTDNSTWTWKKTFTHDSTAGMLGHNVYVHGNHVTYQGVAGRYYKAYVCIWGGDNGAGDTRYFWTSAKKAT